jgi:hypothetical protein
MLQFEKFRILKNAILFILFILIARLENNAQIDTVFQYSDNGNSYYQISSNGWLLYSEIRENHNLKEIIAINKSKDTISYSSYRNGFLVLVETFKYDSSAIGKPFIGDVWEIPGWTLSSKLYENNRIVKDITYNYYYRGRIYYKYSLKYQYEDNELVYIEKVFYSDREIYPRHSRKQKRIYINKDKWKTAKTKKSKIEKLVKSCEAFPLALSNNFRKEWALDSIGDLGLRYKYLPNLNDNLKGMSLECIEFYLGKANEYLGTEHIYYCGYGYGPGERLMINYSDGIVTSVSYTLE